MTNEEKAKELAKQNTENKVRAHLACRKLCYETAMDMAEYKDELIQKFKHHADAMYSAMQNLSTDASQVRKAMEDYHNFLFKEYYTD